jgi:hypothetical protein
MIRDHIRWPGAKGRAVATGRSERYLSISADPVALNVDGLSVEQTAEALEVSAETVMRDWKVARAWLFRQLNPTAPAL